MLPFEAPIPDKIFKPMGLTTQGASPSTAVEQIFVSMRICWQDYMIRGKSILFAG